MSDPAVAVQRQQVRQQGPDRGLVTLPFRLFGVLCGSLLLCIVIECIGMHFFWPEQGWRHAQGMLNYELSQVSGISRAACWCRSRGAVRGSSSSGPTKGLFVKTGLLDWIRDAASQSRAGAHSQVQDFRYYLGQVSARGELPDRLGLHRVGVPRAAAGADPDPAAVRDGCFRRPGRWAGAQGRARLRRRARIGLRLPPGQGRANAAGGAALVTYLALPVSVHPLLILLPSAALLGVAVAISAATFKKYL